MPLISGERRLTEKKVQRMKIPPSINRFPPSSLMVAGMVLLSNTTLELVELMKG